MGTWIGTQATLGEMLNSLIELNHDECSAYMSALTRIEREEYRVRLRAMASDLRRHIDDLKPHAQALIKNISDSPSPKEILTKGRVLLASLVGDEAILRALQTNQQDLQTAYEQAVAFAGKPAPIQELLETHLRSESEHQKWFNRQIACPPGPTTLDEHDATLKMRSMARLDADGKTLQSSTDI